MNGGQSRCAVRVGAVAVERRPGARGRGEHDRRPHGSPRAVRRRDHRQARQRRRNGASRAPPPHLGEPRGLSLRGAGPRDRQRRAGRGPSLARPHRAPRPGAGGTHRRDPAGLRRRDEVAPREARSPGRTNASVGPVWTGVARRRPKRGGDGSRRRGPPSRPARGRVRRRVRHRPAAPGPLRTGAGRRWCEITRRASRAARQWSSRGPRSSWTDSAWRRPDEPPRSTRVWRAPSPRPSSVPR